MTPLEAMARTLLARGLRAEAYPLSAFPNEVAALARPDLDAREAPRRVPLRHKNSRAANDTRRQQIAAAIADDAAAECREQLEAIQLTDAEIVALANSAELLEPCLRIIKRLDEDHAWELAQRWLEANAQAELDARRDETAREVAADFEHASGWFEHQRHPLRGVEERLPAHMHRASLRPRARD